MRACYFRDVPLWWVGTFYPILQLIQESPQGEPAPAWALSLAFCFSHPQTDEAEPGKRQHLTESLSLTPTFW